MNNCSTTVFSTLVIISTFLVSHHAKIILKEQQFLQHVIHNVSLRIIHDMVGVRLQPSEFLQLLSDSSCKQRLQLKIVVEENDSNDSEEFADRLELIIRHHDCKIEARYHRDELFGDSKTHSDNTSEGTSVFLKLFGRICSAFLTVACATNLYLIMRKLHKVFNVIRRIRHDEAHLQSRENHRHENFYSIEMSSDYWNALQSVNQQVIRPETKEKLDEHISAEEMEDNGYTDLNISE